MNDEKTIINASGNGTAVMGRWTRRAIDGSVGILVGSAGGAATAYALDGNAAEEATEEAAEASSADGAAASAAGGSKPVILDEAHLAHNVNDSMSFGQAFAAARAEVGPGGVFTWRGGVYGTYYESEWNAMDADDRARYYASISPDIKPEAAANYAQQAPHHHEAPQADVTDGGHSSVHAHNTGENGDGDDGDVKIISKQTAEDGTEYTAIEVQGHRGMVIGANGEPEMAIIDVDNTGTVTNPDVIIDMRTGQKTTVGEYTAHVEAQAKAQAEANEGVLVTRAEATGSEGTDSTELECGMPNPAYAEEPSALDAAMNDDAGMADDSGLVTI